MSTNQYKTETISYLNTMLGSHVIDERYMMYAGFEEKLMQDDAENGTETSGRFCRAAGLLFEHTNKALMAALRNVEKIEDELFLVVLDNQIVVCDQDSYDDAEYAYSAHFIALICI